MKNNTDQFEVLRKIQKNKSSTQELASDLGFSLGKLNCAKSFTQKGL